MLKATKISDDTNNAVYSFPEIKTGKNPAGEDVELVVRTRELTRADVENEKAKYQAKIDEANEKLSAMDVEDAK